MENISLITIRETENEQKVKEAFKRAEQIYGEEFVKHTAAIERETVKTALAKHTSAFDTVTNLDINKVLLIESILALNPLEIQISRQKSPKGETKPQTKEKQPILALNRKVYYGKVKNALKTIDKDHELRFTLVGNLLDSIERRNTNEQLYSRIINGRRKRCVLQAIADIREYEQPEETTTKEIQHVKAKAR